MLARLEKLIAASVKSDVAADKLVAKFRRQIRVLINEKYRVIANFREAKIIT